MARRVVVVAESRHVWGRDLSPPQLRRAALFFLRLLVLSAPRSQVARSPVEVQEAAAATLLLQQPREQRFLFAVFQARQIVCTSGTLVGALATI